MKSEFRGKVFEYVGLYFLVIFATILTLGIASPWLNCKLESWVAENSVIDGKRLYFDGKGSQLFWLELKWLVFIILTIGIYSFWATIAYQQWRLEHTHILEDENATHEKNVKVF